MLRSGPVGGEQVPGEEAEGDRRAVCRGQTAFGLAEGALGGPGRPQRPPLLGLPPTSPLLLPSSLVSGCPSQPGAETCERA